MYGENREKSNYEYAETGAAKRGWQRHAAHSKSLACAEWDYP